MGKPKAEKNSKQEYNAKVKHLKAVYFSSINSVICCPAEIQQALAAFQNVKPRAFKITGIPWVGDFSRAVAVFHQQVDFTFRIAATDAVYISDICMIHPNQKIKLRIVLFREPPGGFSRTADIMLRQLTACRWINGVPDFFIA